MLIEVGLQIRGRQRVIITQPFNDSTAVRVVQAAIQFGAITGGQNRGFMHAILVEQILQGIAHPVGRERHLFAHANRRGSMIEAKSQKRHEGNCFNAAEKRLNSAG